MQERELTRKILEYHAMGHSARRIAAALETTRYLVRRTLIAEGVAKEKIDPELRHQWEGMRSRLEAMLAAGGTVTDVSRVMGCSRDDADLWLLRLKLVTPERGPRVKRKLAIPGHMDDAAVRMAADRGMPIVERFYEQIIKEYLMGHGVEE